MNKITIIEILAVTSLVLNISPAMAEGYSPLGLRVGSFTVSPSLESSNMWNDNIYYRQSNPIGGFIFNINPSLSVRSNWGRHALNFNAGGNFMFYKNYATEDKQNYSADLGGRLDVLKNSFATAKFYYRHSTESRGSPEPIANRSINPLANDTFGATFGYEHKINRLRANLSHDINYIDYQDGRDPFGTVVANSQRNHTTNTTTARLGYELFSGYEPYIQGSYNFVDYQSLSNLYGNQNIDRSSQGYNIAAGIAFDLSHVLVGSAHVGYQHQDYNSPSLKPMGGMAGGLSLTWLPTRLTTVTAGVERSIQETTQANLSGFFSTMISARVAHKLMENMTLDVHTSYTNSNYQGTNALKRQDDMYNAGLSLNYLVNRYLYVKGGYDYGERVSNINNQNYNTNSIYFNVGTQF